MGSVLKEIGVKQPVDTNKDKKRDTVRRKLTLHGMPLQTAFGQKQRIRFDKAWRDSWRIPLIQLWPSWSPFLQIFWSPMVKDQSDAPSAPLFDQVSSTLVEKLRKYTKKKRRELWLTINRMCTTCGTLTSASPNVLRVSTKYQCSRWRQANICISRLSSQATHHFHRSKFFGQKLCNHIK